MKKEEMKAMAMQSCHFVIGDDVSYFELTKEFKERLKEAMSTVRKLEVVESEFTGP